MGFAENVLNKVRGTPSFKPASVDSFGNWAIEAGDVITVENDGVTEHIPIFSSDMSWNGSAKTTMSCTGNQKREIQDKQTRKDNAMSSGLSEYIDENLEELGAEFGVQLGGVKSALDVYVKNVEGLQEASAELATRVDGAEARIGLNAKNIDGVTSSVAEIEADVIKLQGDTEILGNLTIVDGNLKSTRGIVSDNAITGASIYANGTGTQGIISGRRVSCSEIAVGGKEYTPIEITSTTGTVRVLGIA